MSTNSLSCATTNGDGKSNEVENGHPTPSSPALDTYTVEEMVQQMKELIMENNELKEAMRQRNQAMKERFQELSVWSEKQKEEREFYASRFKEAKQCLADKCIENETLRKQNQVLEEKSGGIANENAAVSQKDLEQELEQLKTQVTKLQAEKADLVAIVSELQLKLNGTTAEDSFVEIKMHEGEVNGGQKENKDLSGKQIDDAAIYVSRSTEEAKNCLESEELTVRQLLHCLRNETQRREALEKDLQEKEDKLLRLGLKPDQLEKGSQTEQEEAKENTRSAGSEIETLNLQVTALFKELQDTHAKLSEAEQIQKKLQEKCQALVKKHPPTHHPSNAPDLNEKQQLMYTVKKLELQVESMQSEIKLEQAKTEDEKEKFNKLQDAYSKLLPELTQAMQTIEVLKDNEASRVDKIALEKLTHRLDLAEQALAAKQFQIDDMKQTIAKQEEELETVGVLRAQMELYCSDFHAERAAREKMHEEKEQLAVQLAYLLAQRQDREDFDRQSLSEMQSRHGVRPPSDQESSCQFSQGLSEDQEWDDQQRMIPIHSCPKCGMILPDIDTLQIHVMDCII